METDEFLVRRGKVLLSKITSVKLNVLKLFKKLSFGEWWNHTSNLSLEDLKRFDCMLSIISGQQALNWGNVGTPESFLEYFAENKEIQSIITQEYDNLSNKDDIKGKATNVVGYSIINDCKEYVNFNYFRISICIFFNRIVNQSYKTLEKSLSCKHNSKHTQRMVRYYINLLDKIAQKYPSFHVTKQVVAYRNAASSINEIEKTGDVRLALQEIEKFNKQFMFDTEKELTFLFVLLNTTLLPYKLQVEIVDYLKSTPFNSEIQRLYNIFVSKMPETIDWVFCRKQPISKIAVTSNKEITKGNYVNKLPNTLSKYVFKGNRKKEKLGKSNYIFKIIKKNDKEFFYRKIVEAIYQEFACNPGGEFFECPKIDFLYLLDADLQNDEKVSDNPVINWVDNKLSFQGFMYALYQGFEKVNGGLINGVSKGDKKFCYSYKGEGIKLTENKRCALEWKEIWQKKIKDIANNTIHKHIKS